MLKRTTKIAFLSSFVALSAFFGICRGYAVWRNSTTNYGSNVCIDGL